MSLQKITGLNNLRIEHVIREERSPKVIACGIAVLEAALSNKGVEYPGLIARLGRP